MIEMKNSNKQNSTAESNDARCPRCESSDLVRRQELDQYVYGRGAESVKLDVSVPVYKCQSCGCEFLGNEAEDIYHSAVCRHLGVMTPAEIRKIRDRYNLNRVNFAEITKLGEATLARWESGSVIQNPGNDQFLYLLTFADNVQRLKDRISTLPLNPDASTNGPDWKDRLKDQDTTNRSVGFALRRAA
jgi:putative zinc finger/helix-turn-helix YgiT family protein